MKIAVMLLLFLFLNAPSASANCSVDGISGGGGGGDGCWLCEVGDLGTDGGGDEDSDGETVYTITTNPDGTVTIGCVGPCENPKFTVGGPR